MSNPKLRMIPRETREITPRPRHDSSEFVPWRLGVAHMPECCRWECVDGRWVSLTLCLESEFGKVAVRDSGGRTELADSYENALALAKKWRTE